LPINTEKLDQVTQTVAKLKEGLMKEANNQSIAKSTNYGAKLK
jgi:hypothetical protein